MPFTPFHWGPSSWIGMVLFRFFDLPTLFVARVVVDIEPFCVLQFDLDYPLHGFFHSFLGGSIFAVLTATTVFFLKDYIKRVMTRFKLEQNSSFKKILWTSFFGVYSHILLDAPLYADIRPFYPLQYNPFYGLFSSQFIYFFCGLSFIVGISIYLVKLSIMRKKDVSRVTQDRNG